MLVRKTLLLGLISVSLLSGCSWFSGEEDVVKMSPLPQVTNQFLPNKLWDTSVGSGIGKYYSHLRPDTASDRIYAADRKGTVAALDANTGKPIWTVNLSIKNGLLSANLPAKLSGGLTVTGNRIYVGSELGVVYSLSADDGSVIWQSDVAGEVLSRPVISEGYVLVHTSNGLFLGLDESTGDIKWTVNLDMPSLSLRGEAAPAVAQGAAIIGGNNGRVSAVLIKEGQLIWQQLISTPKGGTEIDRLNDINTTPQVVDNIVYSLGYNGNLVALDLSSGKTVWRKEMGSVNNFIIGGQHIYLVDQNDKVVALNLEGGTPVWQQSGLLHRGLTAPIFYKGNIVTADSEGYLHWMDASSGKFVAQQQVDSSGFLGDPIISNDHLIFQARNGKVYAFGR